jgi:nascent polypeptide-associated complex subunit alpha
MFPNLNLDPRALKGVMDKLGIRSQNIESTKVVISCQDRDIVIEEPQVVLIEGQGVRSFQISGDIREVEKAKPEISEEDIRFVQEQTGAGAAEARQALEDAKGDNAAAILRLKKEGS